MSVESRKSLLKRHPVKTVVLLLLIFFIFLEAGLRIAFAVKGYQVGNMVPGWHGFVAVDTLIEQKQFYTDGRGIYRAYKPYWDDYGYAINEDGFRGREFNPKTDSGTITLFNIGDSFTWGSHADPIDSCFVDLLDDDPRLVSYNAGIPGTGPAQYLLVAQTFVPKLKPAYVLVHFYLANDLMEKSRKIMPNVDLHYQTNAGWLPAFYKDRHFKSAQEAYDFIKKRYLIEGTFNKLISKTATGTFFLSLPLRIEEYTTWKKEKQGNIPNDYLKKIKAVADRYHAKLLIFVIPSSYADFTKAYFEDRRSYVFKNYPHLFEGLEGNTFILPMKPEYYYEMPDGHLNNKGHQIAAGFMKGKILQ